MKCCLSITNPTEEEIHGKNGDEGLKNYPRFSPSSLSLCHVLNLLGVVMTSILRRTSDPCSGCCALATVLASTAPGAVWHRMEQAPCDVMARGDRAVLFVPYL